MNEPTFSYKVSDTCLTSISLNNKGDKLIIGDEEGKIFVVKLSKSFYDVSDTHKKEFLEALLEREVLREKNIDAKKKPIVKDESQKLLKLEQNIKEKVKKIDEDYAQFISKIFDKSEFKKQ